MNDFPKEDAIKIKALTVKQPIGTFYIGVAKASEVVSICSAKERKRDELENYIGIQRPLHPKRVEEIRKYVKTWDASFPNSVILSINPGYFYFDGDVIYIKRSKDATNIIDGQHRLAGFDEKSEDDFEIILTLFPELEFEEQAYLFSVINTKMTRINPSLAQDLYEFSKINTPAKLAHNIAKSFNYEEGNPWYKKIKMLGRKEGGEHAVLSQSTFTREIINLICKKEDFYEIRDILKRNNNDRSSIKNFYVDSKISEKFIFWKPFMQGEDKLIYIILKDYFSAVREVYPDNWDDTSKILTKTTGYIALMRVLRSLFKKGLDEKNLTKNFFRSHFQKAKNSGKVKGFTSSNYNPGSMGETELTKDFSDGMEISE